MSYTIMSNQPMGYDSIIGLKLTLMVETRWLPSLSGYWIHLSCPYQAGYWSVRIRTAPSILSAPTNIQIPYDRISHPKTDNKVNKFGQHVETSYRSNPKWKLTSKSIISSYKELHVEDNIIIETQPTTLETIQYLCNRSLNFTVTGLNSSSLITIIII